MSKTLNMGKKGFMVVGASVRATKYSKLQQLRTHLWKKYHAHFERKLESIPRSVEASLKIKEKFA